MKTQLFPYANVIAGILIFIVGFIFHWIGQLISLINWDFAVRLGIAEKEMIPEFKVYETAIARADVALGWIYGVAATGLVLDLPWAYKLAWFPAAILIYHGLSFWFWVGNQNESGHRLNSAVFRSSWFLANFVTGVFTILAVW